MVEPAIVVTALRGAAAAQALLQAFLRAKAGEVNFDVTYGHLGERHGELLVLIELGGVKALFSPAELERFSHVLIEGIPDALRMGAPEAAAEDVRDLAALLLESARDAAGLSPHGAH